MGLEYLGLLRGGLGLLRSSSRAEGVIHRKNKIFLAIRKGRGMPQTTAQISIADNKRNSQTCSVDNLIS
jgi:hypothetical protein